MNSRQRKNQLKRNQRRFYRRWRGAGDLALKLGLVLHSPMEEYNCWALPRFRTTIFKLLREDWSEIKAGTFTEINAIIEHYWKLRAFL